MKRFQFTVNFDAIDEKDAEEWKELMEKPVWGLHPSPRNVEFSEISVVELAETEKGE